MSKATIRPSGPYRPPLYYYRSSEWEEGVYLMYQGDVNKDGTIVIIEIGDEFCFRAICGSVVQVNGDEIKVLIEYDNIYSRKLSWHVDPGTPKALVYALLDVV